MLYYWRSGVLSHSGKLRVPLDIVRGSRNAGKAQGFYSVKDAEVIEPDEDQ